MSLKDIWEDLKDATEGVAGSGDDITVEPINAIAHAVIDLENQEPIQSNVQADWNEENPDNPAYINNKPTLSSVATSGNYEDLSNKPIIPSIKGLASIEYVDDELLSKSNKFETYTKTEVDNIINPYPITEPPTILEINKEYNFGEVETLSLVFPTIANDGDVIYLTFKSGEVATTLAIDTTNTTDIEVVPEANCYYDIFAKFNGSVWLVNYSEYLVSEV